jgi:hypothetical protein
MKTRSGNRNSHLIDGESTVFHRFEESDCKRRLCRGHAAYVRAEAGLRIHGADSARNCGQNSRFMRPNVLCQTGDTLALRHLHQSLKRHLPDGGIYRIRRLIPILPAGNAGDAQLDFIAKIQMFTCAPVPRICRDAATPYARRAATI